MHDGGEGAPDLVKRGRVGREPVQAGARVRDDGGEGLVDLVRDRRGQLPQRRHAGHARELGLGLVQGVLGPLALGDVVVRLEDRRGLAGCPAPQGPSTGHHDRRPVAPRVHELAFPASGARQLGHDLGERGGEDGLHAGMGHRADRLRLRPPVELLRAAIPVGDDVLLVPDEDGVVRQVEQRGLIPEGFFHAHPGHDLGLQSRVAVREVRGPRLDPELELVA